MRYLTSGGSHIFQLCHTAEQKDHFDKTYEDALDRFEQCPALGPPGKTVAHLGALGKPKNGV